MKNALPIQRKFLAVDRGLLRKFTNVRACHEGFFSRTSENQHAHTLIATRIEQSMLQLFHRLAVQRIQHLRPVEGNVGNPIFLLIQNVLVSHLSPLFGSAFLGVLCVSALSFFPGTKTSAPSGSPDRNNHKILAPTSSRSIPPAPCVSEAAAPRIAAP